MDSWLAAGERSAAPTSTPSRGGLSVLSGVGGCETSLWVMAWSSILLAKLRVHFHGLKGQDPTHSANTSDPSTHILRWRQSGCLKRGCDSLCRSSRLADSKRMHVFMHHGRGVANSCARFLPVYLQSACAGKWLELASQGPVAPFILPAPPHAQFVRVESAPSMGEVHHRWSCSCPLSDAFSTWATLPTRSADLKGFARQAERFARGGSPDINRTGKCELS